MITKNKQILSDEEIRLDSKNRDHNRKQKIENAKTNIIILIIAIIPASIAILAIALFVHYIRTDNWEAIEKALQSLFIYAGGFITYALAEKGIKKDQ